MDGNSITFQTDLDNSRLEKKYSKTVKEIEHMEDKLSAKKTDKSSLEEYLQAANRDLKAAKAALSDLREEQERAAAALDPVTGTDPAAFIDAYAAKPGIDKAVAAQEEKVASLQTEFDKLNSKVEKYEQQINDATRKIEEHKAKAAELIDAMNQTPAQTEMFDEALGDVNKRFDKLQSRITKMISRVFLFSMFTSGLRAVRSWMGDVIKTNDEASAALARLKGALLTMVQPLVNVVIPAFTTLVNILTAVIGKIAAFFAYLGGTTTEESAKAAEALNAETEALNNTGSAAKKASKSLMGFDEINKLSDDSSGGSGSSSVSPDFSWASGVTEEMSRIADYVLLIAAGLALWKIGSALPGALGDILGKFGLILVAIGGLLLAWDGIKDAWENGVDWGNVTEIIAGLAVAALAVYKAFGKIGAGITLVVGGAALIVTAFHDMMENGMNLQNTFLAVAGILAAGIGIGLLVGSWIPLLIAGIVSLLLVIVNATGHGGDLINGLKTLCQGFIDFFTGVFTGDWEKAWEGIKNVAIGAVNILISIVNSMISLVVSGLNMLRFDVPEWIPGIGGRSVGFNIQNYPQIPYLAQGAVIPPNREFLAILGDQKSGTNIEAPLSTIEQALRNVLAEQGGSGGDIVIKFTGDLAQLARILAPEVTREQRSTSRALGG